jgi:hypothetical protein
MSLPTKSTGAKAQRSERPANTGSQKRANGVSPTIETANPEDPAMRTETSGICDINSDTPQAGSGGASSKVNHGTTNPDGATTTNQPQPVPLDTPPVSTSQPVKAGCKSRRRSTLAHAG